MFPKKSEQKKKAQKLDISKKRFQHWGDNMFPGISSSEILVILLIAFILLGPKNAIHTGKQIGRIVNEFRQSVQKLKKDITDFPEI